MAAARPAPGTTPDARTPGTGGTPEVRGAAGGGTLDGGGPADGGEVIGQGAVLHDARVGGDLVAGDKHVYAAPPPPRPAQLPGDIPDFVGRDMALGQLFAALEEPRTQALVITAIQGMAGVGKTALAVHWAHQVRDRFPDAQLFLDMHGYSDRGQMSVREAFGRLLRALGVPGELVPDDEEEQAALYRTQLANRRVLVVLDNVSSSDQVRPLLPGHGECLVVVTSRNQLPGLVAAEGARTLDLDVLAPREAVDLVSTVLGTDRVTAESSAAADLARRCAYLPLALRIAAANLVVRPEESIAGLVDELGHDRLAALTLDEDPGGAVRSAFDLSYGDLGDDQRRTFRRLGLLEGPDTTPETTAALLGVEVPRALRLLRDLSRAHLVAAIGGGRYRVHDLLREYAREHAAGEDDPGEREAALLRLVRWYHRGARAASAALSGPNGPAARAWFEAERENLVAVTGQAARAGRHELTWQLADAQFAFLELRHFNTFNLEVHRLGMAAAQAAGTAGDRAVMLHHLAVIHRGRGRYDDALRYDEHANDLWSALGDSRSAAAAQNGLARTYRLLSDYPRSLDHAATALKLNRDHDDRYGEGDALDNIAQAYWHLSRFPEALEHAAEALEIRRITGDRRGEGQTLDNIGQIHLFVGDYAQAARHLLEALDIAQEVGDRHGEAETLDNLARTYRHIAFHAEALRTAQQALRLREEIGDRHGVAETNATLGRVHANLGHHREALAHYETALATRRQIRHRRGEGETLGDIGVVYLLQGRYPQAREHVERALEIRREIGERVGEAEALGNLALIYRYLRRLPEAVRLGLEALDIRQEIGDRRGEADTFEHLSRAYRRLGAYGEAERCAGHALRIRTEIGDRGGQGRAQDALAVLYRMLRRLPEALDHGERALAIAREVGDRSAAAWTLNSLAKIHLDAGDGAAAEHTIAEAGELTGSLADEYGRAMILHTSGVVHMAAGDDDAADAVLIQALEIRDEIGDAHGQARTCETLAALRERGGDDPGALDYALRGAGLARDVGALSDAARMTRAAAQPVRRMRGPDAARDLLAEASRLFAEAGDTASAKDLEPLTTRLSRGATGAIHFVRRHTARTTDPPTTENEPPPA